jgi:hypothetical protein
MDIHLVIFYINLWPQCRDNVNGVAAGAANYEVDNPECADDPHPVWKRKERTTRSLISSNMSIQMKPHNQNIPASPSALEEVDVTAMQHVEGAMGEDNGFSATPLDFTCI